MEDLASVLCGYIERTDVFGECLKYLHVEAANIRASCRKDICAMTAAQAKRIACNYIAAMSRECQKIDYKVEWMEDAGEICKGMARA